MDLKQLKYFTLISHFGSLSKAAKASNVTQSLLSRRLAQLESEWGELLFHRTGRGVVLTEFGERMLPHAQGVLTQLHKLEREAKAASGAVNGVVKIGLLPSLAREVAPLLFSEIKHMSPFIQLQIVEDMGVQLEEHLASGRIDLAVLNRYGNTIPSGEDIVGKIDSYLVGSTKSQILAHQEIDFRLINGLPLVLPAMPNGFRRFIEESAKNVGISLNVVIEASSLLSMRTIASRGEAYMIAPFLSIDKEIASGDMKASRIVNPRIYRTLTVCSTGHHPLSRAARLVLPRLRSLTSDILSQKNIGAE